VLIRPDIIVLLAVLAVLALGLVWALVRNRALGSENQRLAANAEQAREILAAAPDGLFLWDHGKAEQRCSRRLAVLLGLETGTAARFDDVLAKFAGSQALALENAVMALHRSGDSFDLMLRLGKRTIQATGTRAAALDGRPLDDLMWMRDVTEDVAKTVENASKTDDAAFDHFRMLLDVLPIPVWIRGSGLEVVFVNQAAADIAAIPHDATSADLARNALANTRAVTENRRLDRGGVAVILDVTEVPARGWAGTIGFAMAPSPLGDGAMASSDRIQGEALDHLRTAIAIFGSDTRLTYNNAAFAKLWQLDRDWLAEKPGLSEILDRLRDQRHLPEVTDFRAFKEEWLALFKTQTGAEESLLHLPDGRTLRHIVAPHSPDGLVFSFEDVSDRLALERSFKTLNAVQRETLDNLYEGIAVFGSDGKLQLSNPVFADLWGIDDDIGDGLHMSDFIARTRPKLALAIDWSDDDWHTHASHMIARLSGRQPSQGRISLSGGTILDYSNVPLPDGAMLLSYLDVSDSARVEAALRQRANALQQASRLKSEFIANVSYEVRTPLTSLLGFADILHQQYFGTLNERQLEYSRGIIDSAQSLMDVINDILDMATIEAGMMQLELDTLEIHSTLAAVLRLIHERARHKDLNIVFDCPPDIGWMVADGRRLKQVLFNLLSNAVRITPPRGTVKLTATRQGDAPDDTLIFTVTDTGKGIPAVEQLDIFGAFEGGSDQTGLGLSLVKRFIELHGGTVEVKSPPGKGATIICRMPAGGGRRTGHPDISVVEESTG